MKHNAKPYQPAGGPWFARFSRCCMAVLLAAFATVFSIGNVSAKVSVDEADPFADLPVIELQELAQMRGGFEFQGLQFEFGANLRTFIDGALALESVISIAKDGMITREHLTDQARTDVSVVLNSQQVVENGGPGKGLPGLQAEPNLENVAGAADAGLSASGNGVVDAGTATSGNSAADTGVPALVVNPNTASADNIDLAGAANTRGIVIQDVKGYTAALHEVRRDQIVSLIVNAASDRTIRQEIDVSVTVENFKQFQRSVLESRLLNGRIGR